MMPSLRDLEATFLKIVDERSFNHDVPFAEAQGVLFLCPLCYAKNGGSVGTHSVICWFVGVPLTMLPGPGRWNPSGTGLDDLTFVGPGAVSVLLTGDGCGWHGFVRNGHAD